MEGQPPPRCLLPCGSVGLIGRQQSGVHRLHAGWTGEGSHEPVVYAVHVVDVHAGQEPNGVTIDKVHHADHAPVGGGDRKVRYILACSGERSFWLAYRSLRGSCLWKHATITTKQNINAINSDTSKGLFTLEQ